MNREKAIALAIGAGQELVTRLGIAEPPDVAVVLGTGWGDALRWDEEPVGVAMSDLRGFEQLGELHGHRRWVLYGTIEGKTVVALQGRVHVHESPFDTVIYPMVRLQTEMLMQLGVRQVILTAAAGSLRDGLLAGDFMVVDGFISLFAPAMPLFGEFESPEDTLDQAWRELALEVVDDITHRPQSGGYAMVRGPHFEGRKYDKRILASCGASSVGMSTLPEASIAMLYKAKVLALNFITNSAVEEHSHEVNTRRAKSKAKRMGRILRRLITQLPST